MPIKLFVGNLSFQTSEEGLRQYFSGAGDVVSVLLPLDRETGRRRGFGFVEMSDEGAAESAISMFNNTELDGRVITVNKARPKEDLPPRPRRF